MSHYWTADDPEPIRRAQAEDWIADLSEFSPEAVELACNGWRRKETRRPTIAGLRDLAAEAQSSIDRRKALPAPQSIGFPSFGDRDYLRDKVSLTRGTGYSTLTDEEKRRYHAYDYAFRAICLDDRAKSSPIDEGGRWHDASMVAQAERMFRERGFRTPGAAA